MTHNKVAMKWIEKDEEWRLKAVNVKDIPEGKTLQEFYDCPTMPKFFEGLNKHEVNEYDIIIIKKKRR